MSRSSCSFKRENVQRLFRNIGSGIEQSRSTARQHVVGTIDFTEGRGFVWPTLEEWPAMANETVGSATTLPPKSGKFCKALLKIGLAVD